MKVKEKAESVAINGSMLTPGMRECKSDVWWGGGVNWWADAVIATFLNLISFCGVRVDSRQVKSARHLPDLTFPIEISFCRQRA